VRNSFRGLPCVYCGAPATTDDHVIAAKFFLEPQRGNLPEIPACQRCNNRLLGLVQMRVLVGNGDGLRTRKNRLDVVLSRTHPAENLIFRFDGLGGGELTARNALRALDDLKFAQCQSGVKVGADLAVSDFPHAAPEAVADQGTLIHNGLALEVLVAGKVQRFSNSFKRVNWFLLLLGPFARRAYNSVGLVSEVRR